MDKYKMMCCEMKKMRTKCNSKDIHVQSFSFNYLKKLLTSYWLLEFCERRYCCSGEDSCCWYEEPLSWLDGLSESQKALRGLTYIRYVKMLLEKRGKSIYDTKVIIGTSKKYLYITIPFRDTGLGSYHFIFDMSLDPDGKSN